MPGLMVGADISAVEHHDVPVALDLHRQGLHGAADLLRSRRGVKTDCLR